MAPDTAATDEWPGDGREPCGCNGTPHWLTDACPLPPPRYVLEPDGLYDY